MHGNTNLELAWTVAPVIVLVAIGAFVFYKLPGIQDVPSASAAGRAGRRPGRRATATTGTTRYPNGVIAVDQLRAPGRPERPARGHRARLRRDPLAGGSRRSAASSTRSRARPTRRGSTPTAPGIYRGQCAEFCGIQHAVMTADGRGAAARTEFDAWLERGGAAQEDGTSTSASETFRGACAKCHGLAGDGDIGPRAARQPAARRRRGDRARSSATAAARCRRSARTGPSARWRR